MKPIKNNDEKAQYQLELSSNRKLNRQLNKRKYDSEINLSRLTKDSKRKTKDF